MASALREPPGAATAATKNGQQQCGASRGHEQLGLHIILRDGVNDEDRGLMARKQHTTF